MSIDAHLVEDRILAAVAYLIHLDQKRFPFLIPVDFFRGLFRHQVMSGCRMSYRLAILICLTWPLVAPGQDIDEGEFSRTMLGYKLNLLENEFEQAEMRPVSESETTPKAKKLQHVYDEIKCLETEFRSGRYYLDLFDEQIVIVREELRVILADPPESTSRPEPGTL